MHISIKRTGGAEILSGDYSDIKTAVEDCVRKGLLLINADLAGADLEGANLEGANLRGAVLRKTNFRDAYLRHADLRGANLVGANFHSADLRFINLRAANLSGADLRGADFCGADLVCADLRRTHLVGANLYGANLYGATLPDFQLCPEGQAFIAYKKLQGGLIATLEIPADVPRTSSLVGRKCRAQSARVLSIETPDGTKVPSGVSLHDKNFLYRTGEVVSEPGYDPDIRVECTQGVHFFMTKEEAQKYWQ